MSQENKETAQEKAPDMPRAKKEVDLFPALLDRKTPPVVAPRGNTAGPQISMFNPMSFDEALEIVECLRSRASTTICLENMRKIDANRLVDFVTGASAAIDGGFHKLSEQVYLFCPSNVKITSSKEEDVVSKGKGGALDFLYSEDLNAGKMKFGDVWNRPQ